MKPTENNFKKFENITVRDWKKLSPYLKNSYWDLHNKCPDKHLLDHIEAELNLDTDLIKKECKKINREDMKKRRETNNLEILQHEVTIANLNTEVKGLKYKYKLNKLKNKDIKIRINNLTAVVEGHETMIAELKQEIKEEKRKRKREKKKAREETEKLRAAQEKLKQEKDSEIRALQQKYDTLQEAHIALANKAANAIL